LPAWRSHQRGLPRWARHVSGLAGEHGSAALGELPTSRARPSTGRSRWLRESLDEAKADSCCTAGRPVVVRVLPLGLGVRSAHPRARLPASGVLDQSPPSRQLSAALRPIRKRRRRPPRVCHGGRQADATLPGREALRSRATHPPRPGRGRPRAGGSVACQDEEFRTRASLRGGLRPLPGPAGCLNHAGARGCVRGRPGMGSPYAFA
jgi:hypothetical protein